jgi:FkbM family methyltransferase
MHLSAMFGKGVIMDIGANDGQSSLKLAKFFPNNTIFSMEPIEINLRSVYAKLSGYSNVRIMHGALGERRGFGEYPDRLNQNQPGVRTQIGALPNYNALRQDKGHNRTFPIYTVDELFGNAYKLAFGHWDVEGSEVELLKGAEKTIRRDRPFFSVETFPRTNATRHTELMRKTNELGYKCTEISEVCGWPRDCRNLICIPNEATSRCH